jgi:hypothetical protein
VVETLGTQYLGVNASQGVCAPTWWRTIVSGLQG